MRVCANTWVVGVCRIGEVVDLPNEQAREFITRGIAAPVEDDTAPADPTALDDAPIEDDAPIPKRKRKK